MLMITCFDFNNLVYVNKFVDIYCLIFFKMLFIQMPLNLSNCFIDLVD